MDDSSQQRILTLIAISLTFASGAADVASFTRLGNVFTSVMTGNIVLLGLAIARHSLTLASHTIVSIAGYITGVAGGTWIAHGFRVSGAAVDSGAAGGGAAGAAGGGAAGAAGGGAAGAAGGGAAGGWAANGAAGADAGRASGLPGHVGWALLAELILLCGLTVGWEMDGASPAGWAQFCLLAVAATAMGVQSSTVKYMGLSEVSTTYLTGTLTGLVSSLVSPKQATQYRARRFGVLIGLATGAALSGLLIATAADAAPALPLAALVTCIFLALAPRSWWDAWLGRRLAGGTRRTDEGRAADEGQRLPEGQPADDVQRPLEGQRADAGQPADAGQRADAGQPDGPAAGEQPAGEPESDGLRPGRRWPTDQQPGELESDGR